MMFIFPTHKNANLAYAVVLKYKDKLRNGHKLTQAEGKDYIKCDRLAEHVTIYSHEVYKNSKTVLFDSLAAIANEKYKCCYSTFMDVGQATVDNIKNKLISTYNLEKVQTVSKGVCSVGNKFAVEVFQKNGASIDSPAVVLTKTDFDGWGNHQSLYMMPKLSSITETMGKFFTDISALNDNGKGSVDNLRPKENIYNGFADDLERKSAFAYDYKGYGGREQHDMHEWSINIPGKTSMGGSNVSDYSVSSTAFYAEAAAKQLFEGGPKVDRLDLPLPTSSLAEGVVGAENNLYPGFVGIPVGGFAAFMAAAMRGFSDLPHPSLKALVAIGLIPVAAGFASMAAIGGISNALFTRKHLKILNDHSSASAPASN